MGHETSERSGKVYNITPRAAELRQERSSSNTKLTGEAVQRRSEKCLEPVCTAGHRPKYRVMGCVLKGTMGWGQSARDGKRGAFE